jgi:hypothetical protein
MAKGGAHSSRRLLLIALEAFGVWSWGLLHEEDIEEELALFVGSKEQLPYIISWRDFIFEEGAWV